MNIDKAREAVEQARDLIATEMPWEEEIISGLTQALAELDNSRGGSEAR